MQPMVARRSTFLFLQLAVSTVPGNIFKRLNVVEEIVMIQQELSNKNVSEYVGNANRMCHAC